MTAPLMPKATAVWLLDNTTLTFKQIARFCELHELEIRAIAAQIVAKEKLIATELKSAKIDLQDRKAVADFISSF